MSFNDDPYLDVCQNIEVGLKHAYERNPELTDSLCILALENAKIAVKQHFGFAKNESVSKAAEFQDVVNWCVTLAVERVERSDGIPLKEYIARIEKIRRSVQRHAGDGSRSYYRFIRPYLP